MRRTLLGVGVAMVLSACGGTTLNVYNEARTDLTIEIGSLKAPVPGRTTYTQIRGSWKAGSKVVVRSGGTILEEVPITAREAGKTLVYNVQGLSPLHVVDYSGAYAVEGSTPTAPGGRPFKVIASLQGQRLYVAPGGTFLNANEAFPRVVANGARVFRLEIVPPSLATRGIDDFLMQSLATDVTMREHIYFPER